MLRFASLFGADYNAAGLTHSYLDYAVTVSPDGHPRIVPARTITTTVTETGAQAVGGTPPAGTPAITRGNSYGVGANAWAAYAGLYALTGQAGDTLTFTTTALQIIVTFAGMMTMGAGLGMGAGATLGGIKNGAKATISVDGAVLYAVDTYNTIASEAVFLDGLSHTVTITHTGNYNSAVSPIGPITPVGGTANTVSQALVLTAVARPTFAAARWRFQATDATHYTVTRIDGSGTPYGTLTALTTGTHYSGIVPGVDVFLPVTIILAAGDTATATTDPAVIAIESIAFGSGSGAGQSGYTSAVYDLGTSAMRPYLLEWRQDALGAVTGVTVDVGPTPTPDAAWTYGLAPALGGYTTADGASYGTAGLYAAVTRPWRYLRYTFAFGGVTTMQPWIGDVLLYAWDPIRDRIPARLALGQGYVLDDPTAAYLAAFAAEYADLDALLDGARAGASISGATDAALAGHLADLGLARVTGEQPVTARARARAVTSNSVGALSLPTVTEEIALLVMGQPAPVTIMGAPGSMQATCGGVVVTQNGAYRYTVTIPGAPYAGLPGIPVGLPTTPGSAQYLIAQHVTTTLRPVGSVPTITFL